MVVSSHGTLFLESNNTDSCVLAPIEPNQYCLRLIIKHRQKYVTVRSELSGSAVAWHQRIMFVKGFYNTLQPTHTHTPQPHTRKLIRNIANLGHRRDHAGKGSNRRKTAPWQLLCLHARWHRVRMHGRVREYVLFCMFSVALDDLRKLLLHSIINLH